MIGSVTANDILNDIEFELLQGILAQDELGKAVQAVRLFQNQLRSKTFKSLKSSSANRSLVSSQFQINDMIITLLQEMAGTVQAMQLELRKMGQVPRSPSSTIPPPAESVAKADSVEHTE